MKRIIVLFLLALQTLGSIAQVVISNDNNSPDPSAMLEVRSGTKGILIPHVALTASNTASPVSNPATGLTVYNTATAGVSPYQVSEGYYFWNGISWIPILAVKGVNIGDMLYWNGIQWINVQSGQPGQYLRLSLDKIPVWSGPTYPTITTIPATSVLDTSATTGGVISSDGGSPVTARGICWNTTGSPTLSDASASNSAANYFPIGVQLIFAAGFVAFMIGFSAWVGPKRKTSDKLEGFASGIETHGNARQPMPSNIFWLPFCLYYLM